MALLAPLHVYISSEGNDLDLCCRSENCAASTLTLYGPKQKHVTAGGEQNAVYLCFTKLKVEISSQIMTLVKVMC